MNLSNYLVITTELLSEKDKEKILAEVVNIKTPNQPFPDNFTIKWLDHYGRIAVVTYLGTEVLLLFKKMTSQLSNLNLDVAPRAYLKNPDQAWEVIKLVDLYIGKSVGEKVLELEKEIKQKNAMIEMLQMQLDAADGLLLELQSKNRKKDKTKPIIPPLYCSDNINKFLAKSKPLKLQDKLRQFFLHAQGYNSKLVHVYSVANSIWEEPEIILNVKYNNKLFKYESKLDKMIKKAKLEKDITPYIAKALKVKAKKKVVKKKSKKP